jgi:hypothetical protein
MLVALAPTLCDRFHECVSTWRQLFLIVSAQGLRLLRPFHNSANNFSTKEFAMAMGNRAIFALLWVLGIPLPILVIAWLFFGGGCGN